MNSLNNKFTNYSNHLLLSFDSSFMWRAAWGAHVQPQGGLWGRGPSRDFSCCWASAGSSGRQRGSECRTRGTYPCHSTRGTLSRQQGSNAQCPCLGCVAVCLPVDIHAQPRQRDGAWLEWPDSLQLPTMIVCQTHAKAEK